MLDFRLSSWLEEIRDLVGYYAERIGSYLPTFREKIYRSPLLKKGPICCLETSVAIYHSTPCHVSQERTWQNVPYTRHCSTHLHVIASNVFLRPHRVPFHDNFLMWIAFPLVAFIKSFQDKNLMSRILLWFCFSYLSLSSLKFCKLPAKRISSSRRVILLGQCFSCFSLLFYTLIKCEPEMRSLRFL